MGLEWPTLRIGVIRIERVRELDGFGVAPFRQVIDVHPNPEELAHAVARAAADEVLAFTEPNRVRERYRLVRIAEGAPEYNVLIDRILR